mmetsp:Transcript_70228/g.156441  ORF Transcript_70228/g.156441 Transcript_70228/m.156441 type:complete len:644 (-) Transcript_70228:2401-4332(-)
MARTKQTARQSTGGKAPRRQLATRAARDLRHFLTSQQQTGILTRAGVDSARPTSYINCENVLGSFKFGVTPTEETFTPRYSLAVVPSPQTGAEEIWLGAQWASKYDGAGIERQGRPSLSLVLAIDISGSMTMALEGDDIGEHVSKLEVAKRCVASILDQLTAADEVAVLLFNHEVALLQALAKCTPGLRTALKRKLEAVRSGGGTRLELGFTRGMDTLAQAAVAAKQRHSLSRLYFLTDMLSGPSDEAAVLDHALLRATAQGLHTTVVGVGVDLSVGTVERLASLPGGKYLSVNSASEFDRSVAAEFCHDVVPIAFEIKLALAGGFAFERACGSAELNGLVPGSTELTISSEFASHHDADGLALGGMLAFKLRPPAASAHAPRAARLTRAASRGLPAAPEGQVPAGLLQITTSWKTAQGAPCALTQRLAVPGGVAPPSAPALRKALALVRFVDLQAGFCEAEDGSNLQARLSRLQGYRAGRAFLLEEMRAVGDASLGQGEALAEGQQGPPNANFLQTLDQIIEMETAETMALQAAETAAREAAVAVAAQDATEPRTRNRRRNRDGVSARSTAKRSRSEALEFLCPILKTRMADPVCTADGHTFERTAIEQWLAHNNTSPLTGLALQTKTVTPNHALRALLSAQ